MLFVFSLLSFAGSDALQPHIAGARALAKHYVPLPVLEHVPRMPVSEWLAPVIIFGLLLQALGAVALIAWRSNAADERASATLPILPLYRAAGDGDDSTLVYAPFDWADRSSVR